jgi:hypothetical protein
MMRTAPGVFRVVLGLFLFFRADALHAFWQKARPATPGAES